MAHYIPWLLDSRSDESQCYVHLGHLPNASPLMMVQLGWHKTMNSYGYGPTIRDHFLLHFVRCGSGVVRTHEMEYSICENTIFAIYPHQITYYEASPDDPWEYYWIGFEGEWAQTVMSSMGFETDQTIAVHIAKPDAVFGLLGDMLARVRLSRDLDAQMLGILGDMFLLFQAVTEGKGALPAVPYRKNVGQLGHEYTRILLTILQTSYSERVNVGQLAERMNLNRSYMTALFKRDTGLSIKQYLVEYRLQRAQVALQSPELSVKDIAILCGFDDPLYLSRAFRKRFGLSPQEWRAQNKIHKSGSEIP